MFDRKKYYADRYQRLKSEGRCTSCGAVLPIVTKTLKCPGCQEKQSKASRKHYKKNKRATMADPLLLPAEPNKWVAVKDGLPQKSGKYLVCTLNGNVYQTKFYSHPETKGGHWGQKDKGRSITHWMPLPEPPTEREGKK